MRLLSQELHSFFFEKQISFLYHANSVATSITYIQEGGLLSRQFVEENNLFQTEQSSDELDKKFGVWGDIFLDTTDLHTNFGRQNLYGPVCFKISIDFLLKQDYNVWITKDNPIRWNDEMSNFDKYFNSVQDLRANWDNYERHKKMVMIRDTDGPILFPQMEMITIDNPAVKVGELCFYDEMVKGLKKAADGILPLQKFRKRQCKNCYCKHNYLHQVKVSDLRRLFLSRSKN